MKPIERRELHPGRRTRGGRRGCGDPHRKPRLSASRSSNRSQARDLSALSPALLDPKAIKGISEKVLVSHYENDYVGAVKRLTAISTQLAELDFAKAPNFIVNGLEREELIARRTSMILHEIYFDSLGGGAAPAALWPRPLRGILAVSTLAVEFAAMGKRRRRFRLGDPRLFAARQAAGNQWAADHTHDARRGSQSRARYVRARLPHGLRCRGAAALCRCLHGGHPVGQRVNSMTATAASLNKNEVQTESLPDQNLDQTFSRGGFSDKLLDPLSYEVLTFQNRFLIAKRS